MASHTSVALGFRILRGVEASRSLSPYCCCELLVERFIECRRREGELSARSPRFAILEWRPRSCGFPRARIPARRQRYPRKLPERPDSTMTIALSEPATTRFMVLVFCSATVGFTTSLPSSMPMRTARDRRGEWNLRDIQRGGSGGDADHVGIIFAVRGKHHRNNLRLSWTSLRETEAAAAGRSAARSKFRAPKGVLRA